VTRSSSATSDDPISPRTRIHAADDGVDDVRLAAQKLLTLPDDVEVFPAHGAGSACGRNISSETSSTIGMQRKMN